MTPPYRQCELRAGDQNQNIVQTSEESGVETLVGTVCGFGLYPEESSDMEVSDEVSEKRQDAYEQADVLSLRMLVSSLICPRHSVRDA